MGEKESRNVNVLSSRKYILFINTYVITGIIITGLLTWYLHAITIAWIGSLLFLFVPIILKRYITKQFTKEATFEFDLQKISVNFHQSNDESSPEYTEIEFKDIQSYKFEEGLGKSFISIYFRNGHKISFDFEDRSGEEDYIIDMIIKYIKDYNREYTEGSLITLQPSILATKKGLYLIISLGIGWIIISIYLVFHIPKSIPFSTIGGILLFIQLIIQRKRALQIHEEQK